MVKKQQIDSWSGSPAGCGLAHCLLARPSASATQSDACVAEMRAIAQEEKTQRETPLSDTLAFRGTAWQSSSIQATKLR
jgi:hypothetical protein